MIVFDFVNMRTYMRDTVLKGMAGELRRALEVRHLDPKNPPQHSHPPAARAYREYRARGGDQYDDEDEFMQALIDEVGKS